MPKELEKNIMRPRSAHRDRKPREEKEFEERVIEVSRISRVVKGGRRIRFRALIVLGDRKGRVGMGVAKANEVADAVRKASTKAKKRLVNVPIIKGTIPHEVRSKYGAAIVLLKPASSGTSIVAGGSVRAVVELAGISDILAKSMGSQNKVNNVTATIKALQSFSARVVDKISDFDKKSERVEVKEVKVELAEEKTGEKKAEPIKPNSKPAKKDTKAKIKAKK
ncbi:MAG: 30S ribosomal protein S5 [Patescibacteria group bacterium]|jgi:small subunit ribosomal protein S5